MRTGSWAAACAALLVLTAIPAVAADLPKGEELVEKYLKSVGGKEKLEKLKNRVMKGEIVLPDMGMEGTVTIHQQPPDEGRIVAEFEGMGKIQYGSRDDLAWEMAPAPKILEDDDKSMAYRQLPLDPYIDYKERFESVETVEEVDVDGTAAYKVKLTPKGGAPEFAYFAKDSGLLLKTEAPGEEGATLVQPFGDYKEVDGVKVPHRRGSSGGQFNFTMTFNSVEHNVDIPEETFDPPAMVKSMLEAQKGSEES